MLRLLDRLACPFTLSIHYRPSRDIAMSDYWIPIEMDENTQIRLEKALSSCYQVHLFTLKALNDNFMDHAENLLLGDFRKKLAKFLKINKQSLIAQQYSLWRAAEKTFPYFTENKKINSDGKFIAVLPIDYAYYKEIQIEKRQVWQKYLALNSLITTSYGTIYLDKEKWPEILISQAAEKNVPFDMSPFLWHSVLIRIGSEPQLRFNLHNPDSKFGRKAKKAMKQYV